MLSKKMILKTDKNGYLIQQSQLPPNISMEVIFIVHDNQKQIRTQRQPSKKIFHKGKITGDIIAPVVPSEDWNILQ